mmetsp:Transcript_18537/g.37969  ORF Transcript_18537/g.37969 Transcript_18537/m.37969 type:complete len:210 (-) Transcript_18537:10-639(-)
MVVGNDRAETAQCNSFTVMPAGGRKIGKQAIHNGIFTHQQRKSVTVGVEVSVIAHSDRASAGAFYNAVSEDNALTRDFYPVEPGVDKPAIRELDLVSVRFCQKSFGCFELHIFDGNKHVFPNIDFEEAFTRKRKDRIEVGVLDIQRGVQQRPALALWNDLTETHKVFALGIQVLHRAFEVIPGFGNDFELIPFFWITGTLLVRVRFEAI